MKRRALHDPIMWLALLLVCVFVNEALAGGGDCNGHENCNETEIIASGGDNALTNSTGGNRTIALGNSLGDVDIAQCLGSEQWNTPLFGKQKLVINWPCMAEFYLRNGKYELAAMAVCNTEVVDEFASEAACEAAHDFSPLVVVEPEAHVPEEVFHRQEQIHTEQIEELAARVQELETKPEPRPRPATQIVQQPLLTDDKRSALQALISEDEDE